MKLILNNLLKQKILFISLNLIVFTLRAQPEKELILVTVKSDKLELANAIKFLNASDPKLICINFDLLNCDEVQQFPSNHSDNVDISAVVRPTEREKKLSLGLADSRSLLMPSELRPFGDDETMQIIGCVFLYPRGVSTGFINLISNEKALNQVEKFQISNTYMNLVSYHFAVKIALQLNERKTQSFIKSNPNILSINFARMRKFHTYSMEYLYSHKESIKDLKGKVIILGVDLPDEYRLVSTTAGNKKMTTSEIFANLTCQLIE